MKRRLAQLLEERRLVVADLRQEGEVLVGVAEAAHELERHLEPGDEQVGAAERRAARVQIEGGRVVATGPPGDVGRIGVVQVGQQARVVRRVRTGQIHWSDGSARAKALRRTPPAAYTAVEPTAHDKPDPD